MRPNWAWLAGVTAAQSLLYPPNSFHQLLQRRKATDDEPEPEIPHVPQYNASIPIDHFSDTDMRTFSNRYWVNDTYYKAGGPVIFAGLAEGTGTNKRLGYLLAEYNKSSVTAPMHLARELNGIVIAWEHRFYGYSQPFKLAEKGEGERGNDMPVGGVDDYRYLTVEQSLEDIVNFATKHLPHATLSENKLRWEPRGVDATPKPRDHLCRVGVVSPRRVSYHNNIHHSMPRNCTNDLAAVTDHIDRILSISDLHNDTLLDLKTAVYLAVRDPPAEHPDTATDDDDDDNDYSTQDTDVSLFSEETLAQDLVANASKRTPLDVAFCLSDVSFRSLQDQGPSLTVHPFCSYIETFDTNLYRETQNLHQRHYFTKTPSSKSSSHLQARNRLARVSTFMYTNLTSKSRVTAPPQDGIIASLSSPSNNSEALEIGLAAYLHAIWRHKSALSNLDRLTFPLPRDAHAWQWQTWTQFGLIGFHNVSSPYRVGSKFYDFQAARRGYIQRTLKAALNRTDPDDDNKNDSMYDDDDDDDPSVVPDTMYLIGYGGWGMQPSNVMFTDGEYDPWRAFSVSSAEKDIGAPGRKMTQKVPKCNVPPEGGEVFGMVHAGAVHGSDVGAYLVDEDEVEEGYPAGYYPTQFWTAAGLIVKALREEWLPCFYNKTRGREGGQGLVV
ncbi:serine carboxypeptidase S28-domain-containing protein [Podospora didyma]|uniref:Serine carboxypeptidase S28-domain-containing protein n=1 Tax=Podospora didyma TaxID=330526 RepID=A0AAE0KJS3_9PEZI|nr:serine carboxypeptidase S28-domain-containing protein [Podospora didyma]